MKALLLGGLLALSAVLPAAAVDWVMVAGDDNLEYYIDNDSIKTNGVDYIYTTKAVNYQRQTVSIGINKMNCSTAMTALLAGKTYNLQGRFLGQFDDRKNPRSRPILEGSAPSIIHSQLCN
jgi:hypothetical protein